MGGTYRKLFKLSIGKDVKKQELAEKVQISPVTISKMAAGRRDDGSCRKTMLCLRCASRLDNRIC